MKVEVENTVVLIRCTKFTPRVENLAMQMLDQGFKVMAVPDLMNVPSDEHDLILSEFSMPTLPLTTSFLGKSGLCLWNDPTRTGWACGDYVFYRALEEEWDYAWIVEPDVYFLNGATSALSELNKEDWDLIATNFWRAPTGWYWLKPLADVLPDLKIHAMGFPLVRLSRALAIDSFQFRKTTLSRRSKGQRIPNDESIVATTAAMNGHTALDLKKRFPEEFKYWSTVLKYPIEDIRTSESRPVIVHSGLEDGDFQQYALNLWSAVGRGSQRDHERLMQSLAPASSHTLQALVREIGHRLLSDHLRIKPGS